MQQNKGCPCFQWQCCCGAVLPGAARSGRQLPTRSALLCPAGLISFLGETRNISAPLKSSPAARPPCARALFPFQLPSSAVSSALEVPSFPHAASIAQSLWELLQVSQGSARYEKPMWPAPRSPQRSWLPAQGRGAIAGRFFRAVCQHERWMLMLPRPRFEWKLHQDSWRGWPGAVPLVGPDPGSPASGESCSSHLEFRSSVGPENFGFPLSIKEGFRVGGEG